MSSFQSAEISCSLIFSRPMMQAHSQVFCPKQIVCSSETNLQSQKMSFSSLFRFHPKFRIILHLEWHFWSILLVWEDFKYFSHQLGSMLNLNIPLSLDWHSETNFRSHLTKAFDFTDQSNEFSIRSYKNYLGSMTKKQWRKDFMKTHSHQG